MAERAPSRREKRHAWMHFSSRQACFSDATQELKTQKSVEAPPKARPELRHAEPSSTLAHARQGGYGLIGVS